MSESERIAFDAEITERGELHPLSVNATRGRLAKWKGRKVNVVVSRYVKSKSNAQLALVHGPILDAWSDFTGYDKDEVKYWLKATWGLKDEVTNPITGEIETRVRSLRDYNSEEMSTFSERILREGRQMGITFALDEAHS